MDKIFEIIGVRFVGFFTRSVAPSSIFFILFFIIDMIYSHNKYFYTFLFHMGDIERVNEILLYTCLVLIFLSYGYINAILSQLLDYFFKENYSKGKELNSLREQVNNLVKNKYVFKNIDFTDYNAYQVLGKDISIAKSYVDEVKAIHTLVIAISLNLIFYSYEFKNFLFLFLVIIIPSGLQLSKLRYVARNKRLYINYLLDKENDKHKEKNKIN